MTGLMLHDLMNPVALSDEMERGYVREQQHPDDPSLCILNYTHKAQYDRAWNDVTTQCRGLIHRDGLVLARPWPKFFNYGEHPEGSLDLDAPAIVTDKMDGSLGILYPAPDSQLAIATRGSFTSDQAVHATKVLRSKFPDWNPAPGLTFLFEVIYPTNRIVLDYGRLDDLVLLDVLETATGWSTRETHKWPRWPGRSVERIKAGSLADALAIPPRPNAEGLVVRVLGTQETVMVKLKQDDYVALHRLVTGLTPRRVHELMSADPMDDGPIHELCSHIPDEFATWVWEVAADLRVKLIARHLDVVASFQNVLAKVGRQDRRAFALEAVKDKENQALMFMLLDGRDPTRAIWRDLRPSGQDALVQQSEDVA